MIDTSDIDVYLGLDVDKGEHHATALTPAGKKTFDKRLPNSEPKLREVFARLRARHGTVLVFVGADAAALIVPSLANSLQAVLDQRKSSPIGSGNCWRPTL